MELWFCVRDITENKDFELYLPIAENRIKFTA